MSQSATFFDDVVEASGLLTLIAPYTVSRLLISAGVVPKELTPADLSRAMPRLEAGLSVYLDAPKLELALERLHHLAATQ